MKNIKTFEKSTIEIIELDNVDIIADSFTSTDLDSEGGIDLPIDPFE